MKPSVDYGTPAIYDEFALIPATRERFTWAGFAIGLLDLLVQGVLFAAAFCCLSWSFASIVRLVLP